MAYDFISEVGVYVRSAPLAGTYCYEGDALPVDPAFEKATVFITVPHRGEKKPVGTGFVAEYIDLESRTRSLYVVTARHVIAGIQDDTHVRLRTAERPSSGGRFEYAGLPVVGVKDVKCGPWFMHPDDPVDEDIAVAPLAGLNDLEVGDGSNRVYALNSLVLQSRRERAPYMMGDPIYRGTRE